MDTSNWRAQLQPYTRQLIGNKILDKLKSGYSVVDVDELLELQKIAQSVEQKSYYGARSRSDYLEIIASKMVLLEKAREREWKSQLSPESRQRIVNKTAEVLRTHVAVSGPEGLQDIWMLAQSIEEEIFTLATSQVHSNEEPHSYSFLYVCLCKDGYGRLIGCGIPLFQSDYLRKMSLKMLRLETAASPSRRRHGQASNQPGNSVDMNLMNQSSRSRRTSG